MNLSCMPYFSIIIPVYNSEAYIEECLLSVMNQSFDNYEVIIVDDGSTDHSKEIIQELIRTDNRFHYHYQPNQGVSAARNWGIKISKGKYILFIDSDDYIEVNSLNLFYSHLTIYKPNILMGGTREFSETGIQPNYSKLSNYILPNQIYKGEYIYAKMIENKSFIPMACNNIYEKEYIVRTKLSFKPMLYEDVLWTTESLLKGSNILIIDCDFYYYRRHTGSRTYSSNFTKVYDSVFYLIDQLYFFLNSSQIASDIKGWVTIQVFIWYLHLWKCFNSGRLYLSQWPELDKYEFIKKQTKYLNDSQQAHYKFLADSIQNERENYIFRQRIQDYFVFHSFVPSSKRIAAIYYLKEDIHPKNLPLYALFFKKQQQILNNCLVIISFSHTFSILKNLIGTNQLFFINIKPMDSEKINDILKNNKIDYVLIQNKLAIISLHTLENALFYLKNNSNSILFLGIRRTVTVSKCLFKELLSSTDDTPLRQLLHKECNAPVDNPYIYFPVLAKVQETGKILTCLSQTTHPYLFKYNLYSLFRNHKIVDTLVEIDCFKSRKINKPTQIEIIPSHHPEYLLLKKKVEETIRNYAEKNDYTLFQGCMGFSFFLSICSNYFDDKKYADRALSIIEDFNNQIHSFFISPSGTHLITISNSLEYLQKKSLIQASPNFLNSIDDYFCRYVTSGVFKDYSYENGISGIGVYLINRLNNRGISHSHKNKLNLSLHILIDRLTHFLLSVQTFPSLDEKDITDLSQFLTQSISSGINMYVALEALASIQSRFPAHDKNMTIYQQIRKACQSNDLLSIMKIAEYQINHIDNKKHRLKNGLLETYLWRLSRLTGFDLDWWSVF